MPFPALPSSLAEALAARGYSEPTPVQTAVLRPDLAGRDLLVSAQTGSGKTVAYGLAAASDIIAPDGRTGAARIPRMLVVAPTRELALQVGGELEWLYAGFGFQLATCVGGTDMRRERRILAGGADIVVGTPGRLRDHLERGGLDASALRVVVLDEADEMLDLGFREDLEAILDETPAERRTLLFSATVPRGIAALAKNYQRDALRIEASEGGEPHADIEYRAMLVAPLEGERALVNVLRFFDARGVLVFCATREAVARLQGNLLERGFTTVALSGELSQAERSRALQSLRDGRARVCVATDVASRGIDLPDLDLVVHADLPHDPAVLLHRSGRTGRAGRKGTAVLLVPHTRRRAAERLLQAAGVRVQWAAPPTAEQVRAQDRERMAQQAAALALEESSEEELASARLLLAVRSPEQVAAALLRTLRAPLPAAEELSAGPEERSARGADKRGGREPVDFSWFRISIGRAGNAEPRWLLPFLCRRGHVTRNEIGRIRVGAHETEFEVACDAAERFLAAARRRPAGPDGKDGDDGEIRIEPITGPRSSGAGKDGPRSHQQHKDGPRPAQGGKGAAGKSFGNERPKRKFNKKAGRPRTP